VNTRRQIVALYTFAAAGSRPTQICKRQTRGMQNLSDVQLQRGRGKWQAPHLHPPQQPVYLFLFILAPPAVHFPARAARSACSFRRQISNRFFFVIAHSAVGVITTIRSIKARES